MYWPFYDSDCSMTGACIIKIMRIQIGEVRIKDPLNPSLTSPPISILIIDIKRQSPYSKSPQ